MNPRQLCVSLCVCFIFCVLVYANCFLLSHIFVFFLFYIYFRGHTLTWCAKYFLVKNKITLYFMELEWVVLNVFARNFHCIGNSIHKSWIRIEWFIMESEGSPARLIEFRAWIRVRVRKQFLLVRLIDWLSVRYLWLWVKDDFHLISDWLNIFFFFLLIVECTLSDDVLHSTLALSIQNWFGQFNEYDSFCVCYHRYVDSPARYLWMCICVYVCLCVCVWGLNVFST